MLALLELSHKKQLDQMLFSARSYSCDHCLGRRGTAAQPMVLSSVSLWWTSSHYLQKSLSLAETCEDEGITLNKLEKSTVLKTTSILSHPSQPAIATLDTHKLRVKLLYMQNLS